MKKMDDFNVNKEDAAITFSADGTVNIYLPSYEDDDPIDPQTHAHVYTAIAIMMSLEDQRFHDLIAEQINKILSASGAVSPCGGGCHGCGGSCDTEDTEEK